MNTEERSCYLKLAARVEELEKQVTSLADGLVRTGLFTGIAPEPAPAISQPEEQPTFDKLYENYEHACREYERIVAEWKAGKYPGLKLGYCNESNWTYRNPDDVIFEDDDFTYCWNMPVEVKPYEPPTFQELYDGDWVKALRALLEAWGEGNGAVVEYKLRMGRWEKIQVGIAIVWIARIAYTISKWNRRADNGTS